MFDLFDPRTFWLNLTNIALGLITLVCLGAVVRAVAIEILELLRTRRDAVAEPPLEQVSAEDDHAFLEPGLGWTMADGGRTYEEEPMDDYSTE